MNPATFAIIGLSTPEMLFTSRLLNCCSSWSRDLFHQVIVVTQIFTLPDIALHPVQFLFILWCWLVYTYCMYTSWKFNDTFSATASSASHKLYIDPWFMLSSGLLILRYGSLNFVPKWDLIWFPWQFHQTQLINGTVVLGWRLELPLSFWVKYRLNIPN